MLESVVDGFKSIHMGAISLALVLAFSFWVLIRTQQRKDFDFSEILLGEGLRPSVTRLGAVVCLVVSSWHLIYVTMTVEEFSNTHLWMYVIYMGIWSGAKVVEKAIDAWTTSKVGGSGVTVQSTSTVTRQSVVVDSVEQSTQDKGN